MKIPSYRILIGLSDELNTGRSLSFSAVCSHLVCEMVGLGLKASAKFHPCVGTMLSMNRAVIPAGISAECCRTATSNCAQSLRCTELPHQACWFLQCQLNDSLCSFPADYQIEASGLFHVSSSVGPNNSEIKNDSSVQIFV